RLGPGRVLALVADAIDHAVRVVGHEQRAVCRLRDAGEPADVPPAAVFGTRQEAGRERLELDGLAVLEAYPQHLVPGRGIAVPRASHRDERIAAILVRKLVPGIERELHRRGVRDVKAEGLRALLGPLFERDAVRRLVLRIE